MALCEQSLNESWCICSYSFAALSICVFLSAVNFIQGYQIVIYITRTKKYLTYKLGIFYVIGAQAASIHYSGMSIHFFTIADQFNVIYLVIEFCKIMFYSILCLYFAGQAASMIPHEDFFRKLGRPLIIFNLVYFSVLSVVFILQSLKNINVFDCKNTIWVFLSFANTALIVLFIIIGVKTTRQLSTIRSYTILNTSTCRERQLW